MLSNLFKTSLSLLAGMDHLLQARDYWNARRFQEQASYELVFQGNFGIACGLGLFVESPAAWPFSPDDIQFLGRLGLFEESFMNYLQRLRFQCDVDALPEGAPLQNGQTLVYVQGPLIQVTLLETVLYSWMAFSTRIATQAALACKEAGGQALVENQHHEGQGPIGALLASRAAYIGGCSATSSLLAGKIWQIPVQQPGPCVFDPEKSDLPDDLLLFQVAKNPPDKGLTPVFRRGERVYQPPRLEEIRSYCLSQLP